MNPPPSRSGSARVWIAVAMALLLVGALVAIWWELRPPPPPRVPHQAWYYDLNTDQLFAAPAGQLPPIPAPSGPRPDGQPAGVLAHVFACGDCSGQNRALAYLETYTAEDHARLLQLRERLTSGRLQPDPSSPPAGQSDAALSAGIGSMVKRPSDAAWVLRGSPQGQAVVAETGTHCLPAAVPRECYP